MTTLSGGWSIPGVGSLSQDAPREIFWGGDAAKGQILHKGAVLSSTAADAGNSPTTVLRPGLILGQITSTGELAEWNADASDGTQYIYGVLYNDLKMVDYYGTASDRFCTVAVKAPVKASQLLIEGTAFTSHANEHLARRQMVAAGFTFDDDPMGYQSGLVERFATVTGTSDTLTHDENGTTLFYNNAAAVAVTLPALRPGLTYDIVRAANEEIAISSAAGDDMIFGNDLSGDSITFTTASEHIGARVRIRSVYVATTLKWLVEVVCTPIGTDVGGLTFALAS